jgi:hypothetical protein
MMDGMRIRIQGEREVINEISALIEASDQAELIEVEQDDSGIGADFILDIIVAIVTIVSAVFFDKPIVPQLWEILHRHQGTKLTFESPTQTITIESTATLKVEDLIKALSALDQAG